MQLKEPLHNVLSRKLNPEANKRLSFYARILDVLKGHDQNTDVASLQSHCIAVHNEQFIQMLQDNHEDTVLGANLNNPIKIADLQKYTDFYYPNCKINWLRYVRSRFPILQSDLTDQTMLSFGDHPSEKQRILHRVRVFCQFKNTDESFVQTYLLFHLLVAVGRDCSPWFKQKLDELHRDLNLERFDAMYHFSTNIKNYCLLKYLDENELPGFSWSDFSLTTDQHNEAVLVFGAAREYFNNFVLNLDTNFPLDKPTRRKLRSIELDTRQYDPETSNYIYNQLEQLNIANCSHFEIQRRYRLLKLQMQLQMPRKSYKNGLASSSPLCTTIYYDSAVNSIVVPRILIHMLITHDINYHGWKAFNFHILQALAEALLHIQPNIMQQVYVKEVSKRPNMQNGAQTFAQCMSDRNQNFVYPHFCHRKICGSATLRQSFIDNVALYVLVDSYRYAKNSVCLKGKKQQKLKLRSFYLNIAKEMCQSEVHVPSRYRLAAFAPEYISHDARINAIFSNLPKFGSVFGCTPHDEMNIANRRCTFRMQTGFY